MSDRLAEQLAICDAATEGPWDMPIDMFLVENEDGKEIAEARSHADDATFIATARTALPDALKALVKCREALDKIADVEVSWAQEQAINEALAAIEQVGEGGGG